MLNHDIYLSQWFLARLTFLLSCLASLDHQWMPKVGLLLYRSVSSQDLNTESLHQVVLAAFVHYEGGRVGLNDNRLKPRSLPCELIRLCYVTQRWLNFSFQLIQGHLWLTYFNAECKVLIFLLHLNWGFPLKSLGARLLSCAGILCHIDLRTSLNSPQDPILLHKVGLFLKSYRAGPSLILIRRWLLCDWPILDLLLLLLFDTRERWLVTMLSFN